MLAVKVGNETAWVVLKSVCGVAIVLVAFDDPEKAVIDALTLSFIPLMVTVAEVLLSLTDILVLFGAFGSVLSVTFIFKIYWFVLPLLSVTQKVMLYALGLLFKFLNLSV